jgi:hypothetical protein
MSDPFIDALHDRLTSAGSTGGQHENDQERSAAMFRWWNEFADVLGQKVGAWNERQAPRQPINVTRRADGAVHIWHRSAEATFTRAGHSIRASTRLGPDPTRESLIELRLVGDGQTVAKADGKDMPSATAAAEQLLTPLLVEVFAHADTR